MINIEEYGLHTTHEAFKTDSKETNWNLKAIINAFLDNLHNFLTRRDEYESFTGSQKYPFYFCAISNVWSSNGCTKNQFLSNDSYTTCHCDHLTNFAILTAITDDEISTSHFKVLSTLSIICSGVSIFFLCIGILIFVFLLLSENQRHIKHMVHLNLMICLLLSQLIFIFGVQQTKTKVLCRSIAYSLHYFLLASFGWMLVEGFFLYISIVKVFDEARKYIKGYFVIGYFLPLLIVIATAISRAENYVTSKYCWLSSGNGSIWTFLAPIAVIIVINSVILVMVLLQINALSKADGTLLGGVKRGFRSSVILLPILGLGWIFGLMNFNSDVLAFQYIFVVCNALQGLMVTLIHCIFNSEIRCLFSHRVRAYFYNSRLYNIHSSNYSKTIQSLSVRFTHGKFNPSDEECVDHEPKNLEIVTLHHPEGSPKPNKVEPTTLVRFVTPHEP